MLKIGQVNLHTSKEPLFIFWSEGKDFSERLDVIEDTSKYNVLDTSNCVASYIKGNKELIYGDKKIITSILKIKHQASLTYAKEDKEIKLDDEGNLLMIISKQIPDIGLYYEIVLKDGFTFSEYYSTPLGYVNIVDISKSDSSIKPLNIDSYEIVNSITGEDIRLVTNQTSDFYSYEELLRRYPEVSHVLNNDYVVIRSYEEAEERLRIWVNSKEQLKSYDIESLHEQWGVHSDNLITGVFLGLGETWSTYFPFRQDNFDYNLPIEYLRKIFDSINNQPPAPEVILLAHNVKFEIEGFYQEFEEFVRFDYDTYLLAILENPVVKKGTHTLKTQTARVDKNFYLSLSHIFIGKIMFNVLSPDIVLLYGCPDATSPAKIFKFLMDRIPKDESFVIELENKIPYIKAMNEFYGLPIDQDRLDNLIKDEEFKVNTLKEKFMRIHRTSRNINSYVVLKEIIYDKLRCPVEVTTDKGLPSTSVNAINRIVDVGTLTEYDKDNIPADILGRDNKTVVVEGKKLASNKYPSLVIYQAYKKAVKELGALNRIKNHSQKDRFMAYINQSTTGSNRQASDAHQFSDTMKSCVVSDSPYHNLVSCDWMQIELRVLAWLSKQEDLIELQKRCDVDIHRAILSIIQGLEMYLISEEMRSEGKSVNFGVVYMMTIYGLAKKDFGPAYTKKHLEIERKKIMDFFNGLPRVKEFISKNEEYVRTNGFIKTAFKYYRYFPEILDPTVSEKVKSSLVRSANNTPVQGTAAQMLKMVEVATFDYMRERGWHKCKDYDGVRLPKVRMMLSIHDEILLSHDKDIPKEEIIKMFKECMELDFEGAPPFFASPAFVNNWYEGKNPTLEIDIPLRDKILEEYEKGNYMLTGHDYKSVLINYRRDVIKDYMSDLISKYKTVEEVAKNVKHDSLTHVLIETLIPDKKERKKYTHQERIYKAVELYFKSLEENGDLEFILSNNNDPDLDNIRKEVDTDSWLDNNSRIDSNGDIIEEETSEEEIKDSLIEELLPLEDRVVDNPTFIYLRQECLIDLSEYDIKVEGEEIHKFISSISRPTEYYSVIYLLTDGTLLNSKLKIGYVPEELTKLFNGIKLKRLNV